MPATLNDQGIAAAKAGNFLKARRLLESAVAAEPDRPIAYFNLAHVLLRLGDVQAAEQVAKTMVCLAPEEADYHLTLAQVLLALRRGREAVVSAAHAVRLSPQRPEPLRLLAETLSGLEQVAEAAAAYERLVAVAPHDAAALNELGNLYQRLGESDDADRIYARAAEVDPGMVAALANRARFQSDRGNVELARELYALANRRQATPQMQIAAAATLPIIYDSVEQLRQERANLIEQFESLHKQGLRIDPTRFVLPNMFYLAYQGENDREVMELFARLLTPPEERSLRVPAPTGSGQKRIRLGLLSKYLCDHTIGHLNLGLIQHLPRDEFEIVLLRPGGSRDTIAQRYAAAAENVINIPENLPAALAAIVSARLDAIFFPDLGMDPFTFTLAANRLAPRQLCTWGHPDTTGLATVDAFLSVDAELPEADNHYTERLVRLPCLGVGLARPPVPPPSTRAQLGLPEGAHLYGCPQSLFKFHPEFDEVLTGVLERDPLGKLVLIEGNHKTWTERLQRRFAKTQSCLADSERVIWLKRLPREEFRQLISHCDVLLDPLHFGGGHTSYEAFSYGVPVVTLPSAFLRGRLTLSMLRQMNLEQELAVSSKAQFIERAFELGTDPTSRTQLSHVLVDASRSLFRIEQPLAAFSQALQSLRR